MWRCSKSWLSSGLLHLLYYTMLWCFDWGCMNGWWIQLYEELCVLEEKKNLIFVAGRFHSPICGQFFDVHLIQKKWPGNSCVRLVWLRSLGVAAGFFGVYAREWCACRLGRKHHDSCRSWCGQGSSPLQLCHMGRWFGHLLVVTSFNSYTLLLWALLVAID